MHITPVDTRDGRQAAEFLRLPFHLYRATPQWVPPLAGDARRMLDRRRNPFFRHSEAAFLLAWDDRRVVGRLAALDNRRHNDFNRERTAFFTLFECEDSPEAAVGLFEAASDWARGRGLDQIVGPKGFTALDGMGMLVRGFEHRPAFGIPYNLPHYPALVEAAGFAASGEIVSGRLDRTIRFPAHILEVAERVQRRRGLRVNNFETRRDLRHFLPRLQELYNTSLTGTSGNVPLTDEEVRSIADQMLWFSDPRLIKILMKGDEPVGYLFAYPDVSAALQRTRGYLLPFGWAEVLLELRRTKWININGAGIHEDYRGLGGTALLFSEMYKSVTQGRYEHADVVQIGTENDRMQRELRDLGIDFYKTHRLYTRRL